MAMAQFLDGSVISDQNHSDVNLALHTDINLAFNNQSRQCSFVPETHKETQKIYYQKFFKITMFSTLSILFS